jgi:putative ABC transport system substrate-binding protein
LAFWVLRLKRGSSWKPLRAGLRDFGYVEGNSIVIEYRFAEGRYERLPELSAELVGLKVDVIVTHTAVGARAAKAATATIPIVEAVVGDAVAAGLVSKRGKSK